MSIHSSLRGVNTLSGERSVFTRVERIQKLMKDGKLEQEDSPFGLPKVRTHFKVKTAKQLKAEKAGAKEEGTEAKSEE